MTTTPCRLLRALATAALAVFASVAAHAAILSVTPTGTFPASTAGGATATLVVNWSSPDNMTGPIIAYLCSDLDQPDPPTRIAPQIHCAPGADLGLANASYQSPPGVSTTITIIDSETPATVQQALTLAIARGQPAGQRHFWFVQQFQTAFVAAKYIIAEAPAGAPVAVLSTTVIDFGNQIVGTTSAPQRVTLGNTGNAPLNITGLSLTPPFAQTNTCGTQLAPGASCTISLTFTPTSVGAQGRTLLVTTNANGSPHAVNLTGNGIPQPVAGPALAPSALNFGNQQINTTSPPQTIVLSNAGTAPLSAIQVAANGDFAASSGCATTLAPGTSCPITVRFTPSSLGVRVGTLTVASAAGTVTAPLQGTGTTIPVVNPSGLIINVSPRQVTVNTDSPTTAAVTYTFAPNSTGADPVDALFCSALSVPLPPSGATTTNPCAPGSEFARHPTDPASFQSVQAGPYRVSLRETIRVPGPVARYAYLHLRDGGDPVFYLVRKFAPEVYTVVALRLAGNTANRPIALTDVRVAFVKGSAELPLTFVKRDETLPSIGARIYYTGAGILRGRWEVVKPGDVEPGDDDLVPEAALPLARRGSQRRYQLVERFQHYLPATGTFILPGPDVSKLPVHDDGPYRILLRLEAEPAIGGDDPGLLSGGTAPFPLPTLRYFVGSQRGIPGAGPVQPIVLERPFAGQTLPVGQVPRFAWRDVSGAAVYRLEITDRDGTTLLSALLRAGAQGYSAPPFLRDKAGRAGQRWRVTAVDVDGSVVGQSAWRDLAFEKP